MPDSWSGRHPWRPECIRLVSYCLRPSVSVNGYFNATFGQFWSVYFASFPCGLPFWKGRTHNPEGVCHSWLELIIFQLGLQAFPVMVPVRSVSFRLFDSMKEKWVYANERMPCGAKVRDGDRVFWMMISVGYRILEHREVFIRGCCCGLEVSVRILPTRMPRLPDMFHRMPEPDRVKLKKFHGECAGILSGGNFPVNYCNNYSESILPAGSKSHTDTMAVKPLGGGRKLPVILPIFILLIVAGVFFSGCTDSKTELPSGIADIVPAEGAGAARYDGNPDDTLSPAQLSSLRYVTEEFPPLNYREDNSAQGIAVNILEEIFRRNNANISVDVCEFLLWEDGYQAALAGPQTVIFSTARVPSREGLFQWAGPYAEGSIVLFAPAEKQLSLKSPDDLAELRIGAIVNTSSIPHLRAVGVLEESIVTGDSAEALVQMLEEGTIDAWSTGDLSGRYILRQYAANPDAYLPVYTLATNEYYFAFSPDTPEAIVLAFQEGIEEIKNEPGKNGTPIYQEFLYRNEGAGYFAGDVMKDDVIAVVDRCTAEISTNASVTIAAINGGKFSPFGSNVSEIYPFVYDVNTTIVADGGNPLLVGINLSGKTDAAGYAFRDAIVKGALANGTGWVEYVWTHPEHPSLYHKTTYYQSVKGDDGVTYIVCAGMYSQKPDI